MQTLIHKAEDRGSVDAGWLKAHPSFSFGNWYDPERMGFGALRVLNDDEIAPASGFGMHPHQNYEIVTIVLEGAITHEDSMGNAATAPAGSVQVMSAGTGVVHAEHNRSDTEWLKSLQLWLKPNEQNVEPRYEQKAFDPRERKENWQVLVSDGSIPGSLMIHQDARIAITELAAGAARNYDLSRAGNGVYIFVLEGDVTVASEQLGRRDAIGVWETDRVTMEASAPAAVLLFDVPM